MPIGSLTTGEPEVAAMGAEAAAGHITSAPYFDTIDSLENRRFVASYRQAFRRGFADLGLHGSRLFPGLPVRRGGRAGGFGAHR